MSILNHLSEPPSHAFGTSDRDKEPLPEQCQCGRCRGFFRAGSGLVPRTFGDWWACPPCRSDPFPLKQVS
jgi:hypothetical protein